MFPRFWRSALTATLLLVAGAAEAAPIPTLWSTGFDGAGALITPGSTTPDGHYSLISAPAPYGPSAYVLQDKDGNGAPVFPFGCCWFPSNSGDSQWIAPTNVLSPINGDGDLGSHWPGIYRYQTTFDLSPFDFSSTAFKIELYWESDNDGNDPASTSIWLNGVQIPNSSACCKHQFTGPITLTSGFAPGSNTLDFYVENLTWGGPNGGNPTGIRVEAYGSATPVPEPGTLLLAGSAAVVAGTLVRRLRRRA